MSIIKDIDNMSEGMKHFFDGGMLLITLGSLFNYVSPLTAIAALIWFCLRIVSEWNEIKIKRATLKGLRCSGCPITDSDK